MVLRGSPAETAQRAGDLCAELAPEAVLWISARADDPSAHGRRVRPKKARRLLGASFDAVVLDAHDRLDPDVLGQCQGFVWGGGHLVLRRGAVEDVRGRFQQRFERVVAEHLPRLSSGPQPDPLGPGVHALAGSAQQATAVEALVALFTQATPQRATLIADRGRGKSSALGLAIAAAKRAHPDLCIAVTAGQQAAAHQVLRFAAEARPTFIAPNDLAHTTPPQTFDVIVVDEAAQLPVPVLQRIVERHSAARIAFATTARGYEGTGRGFVLRFVRWLEARSEDVRHLKLETPIRWDAGDPLERFVFDALLLDAQPEPVTEAPDVRAVSLDRDALVADERDLLGFFGLLVHAHYRTTPSDLERILDAPNIRLHALRAGRKIVAATMVALEGSLSPETCDALYWGRTRLRGQALPDSLVSHLGHLDAGRLAMVRSVRIAVHPDLRRRGLGTRLIDHVHGCYEPDIFGTLFGATADLLAFRRQAGYELVRVSASRGTRTGEPAALMLRPVSQPAQRLLARLRADLARDLPHQLRLLQAGHELVLDPRLEASLQRDLPAPSPLDDEALEAALASYAHGPRTFESVAVQITAFVRNHRDALAGLPAAQRAVIASRVLAESGWAEATAAAGLDDVRTAMRELRRGIRALVLHAGG